MAQFAAGEYPQTMGKAKNPAGRFVAIIATGGESELDQLLARIITDTVPDVPVEIVIAEATDFSLVVSLAKLPTANLVVMMINNLRDTREVLDDFKRLEEFTKQLRARTTGLLFLTSGVWATDLEQRLQKAGADVIEQAPFKLEILAQAARSAYHRWQME